MLLHWIKKVKIELKIEKTEGIIITKKKTNRNINMKINDFIVPIKDHIKYLGVIIDEKTQLERTHKLHHN